jgi:hypothetical protein
MRDKIFLILINFLFDIQLYDQEFMCFSTFVEVQVECSYLDLC